MIIAKEFQKLIPALLPDEYKLLEANIIRDGCREPLSVWNGVLVDGHNRYGICQRHGIKFETRQVSFDSREHAKLWIGEQQLGRRNLSDSQRIMIADDVRALRSKVAVADKLEKARAVKAGSMSVDSADIEKRKTDTRKAIDARMPPLGLTDAELAEITSLADAIPIENRDGFLRALADVIGQCPADTRGPGILHRAAAQLQRDFLYAPPTMTATGMRSKYR
jgi:hypothetical protein